MIHNGNIHILLFDIINEIISNQAVGIQRYRSVYKLYVKEESARAQLIENGLIINNNKVYSENPYDKNNNTIKITVRELPIEINNSDLLRYLRSLNNIH